MQHYMTIAVSKTELLEVKDSLSVLYDKVSDISSPPNHIILTNKELCAMLKVSSKTVQKWRDNSLISYSKIGREIFYRLSDVLDMLDQHKQESFKN